MKKFLLIVLSLALLMLLFGLIFLRQENEVVDTKALEINKSTANIKSEVNTTKLKKGLFADYDDSVEDTHLQDDFFVKEQENEIQEQLSYLESIVYELEASNTIEEVTEIYDEITNNVLIKDISNKKQNKVNVKKKKPNNRIYKFDKEQFIRFKIDDFDVFVGKNNVQNDYLTLKFASDNDLWFHTKDIHGSHVILRIQDKQPPQEVINKVASIAAKYSKAKFSSNVPVDYTYVKYVKKPNKAKPGMVIYTHEQTVNVQPEK